ncbi:MAG: hypothetical protein HXS54_08030 [Theionarchaea archaeon]|nr:hypothetical protein [Theionarchaea archaeon]
MKELTRVDISRCARWYLCLGEIAVVLIPGILRGKESHLTETVVSKEGESCPSFQS